VEEEKIRSAVAEEDIPMLLSLLKAKVKPSKATTPSGRINYALAIEMVKKAKAVAGAESLQDWQAVLHFWRANGNLGTGITYGLGAIAACSSSSSPSAPSSSQALVQLVPAATDALPSNAELAIQALRLALRAVEGVKVNSFLNAFAYRRLQAHFHQQYRNAERATQQALPRGVRRAAAAKARLFRASYPAFGEIAHPQSHPRCRKEWDNFGRLLEKSGRWDEVGRKLGWGIFGLIPESTIPRVWLERTLTLDLLLVWLDLVKTYNQQAVLAGERLAAWAGSALTGGPIPTNPLQIEGVKQGDLEGYGNKLDLFCEVNREDDDH